LCLILEKYVKNVKSIIVIIVTINGTQDQPYNYLLFNPNQIHYNNVFNVLLDIKSVLMNNLVQFTQILLVPVQIRMVIVWDVRQH